MANTRTDLEELDAFIKLADANPSAKAQAREAFEFMKTRITKLEAAKRRLEDVGVVVMTDEDFDPTYDELYGLYEKQKARITELESALMIREDAQTQGAVNAVNGVYQQAAMDGKLRAPDFTPDAPPNLRSGAPTPQLPDDRDRFARIEDDIMSLRSIMETLGERLSRLEDRLA